MPTLATLSVISGDNPFLDGNIPYTLILDWLSTDLGVVSLGVVATYNAQQVGKTACPIEISVVRGKLWSVETIPGLHGDLATTLPTAYDLTILDEYGFDILAGTCAARSATVAEKVVPVIGIIINSELTLTIASAGDAKTGRIKLEFDELEHIGI